MSKRTSCICGLLLLGALAGPALAGAGEAAPEPAPAPAPPAPVDPLEPQQVKIAVKIVEFQAEQGLETGMSAYFARRNSARLYGRATSGHGNITTFDTTFPSVEDAAITVFLDRLRMSDGDLEVVLQALATENKAFILSRPRALVGVREKTPTVVKTVRKIPYVNPVVVGNTVQNTIDFKDTGVTLSVQVPDLADDDGDWATTEDSYIRLQLTADVRGRGVNVGTVQDVSVPSFRQRTVTTEVWVRHGQTLILGGLYRNRKEKSLNTVPWLTQAESIGVGMAEHIVPGDSLTSPLSASIGNRSTDWRRRELVFFIRTETWKQSYTVMDDHGFADFDFEDEGVGGLGLKPKDVIKDAVKPFVTLPKEAVERFSGQDLESPLGREPGGSVE